MPEYVPGCHSYILNKYSGHLEAQAPDTNINNFELVAIYCPKAQLEWKTKRHYLHSASGNISLKYRKPCIDFSEWGFFCEKLCIIIHYRSVTGLFS